MSFTRRLLHEDIRRIDTANMAGTIAAMGDHIREALTLANAALATATMPNDIQHIIVAGMGGSAIGGDFVRSYVGASFGVPFIVNRSYNLPAYANERTLVIASSYSGNTEETLSQFEQAVKRRCQIVCLTTGGTLGERAKMIGAPVLPLRAELMPRAAFAFSFVPVLLLLERLGFVNGESKNLAQAATLMDTLATRYNTDNLTDANPAFALASQLLHRVPVIYSASEYEVVCLRWRGQIAENAKHLAFGNVLPEMNHNEIEGWSHPADVLQHLFALVLRSTEDESPRMTIRFTALKEVLSGKQVEVQELLAEGATRLERMLSLIAMADWTSLYLALFAGTDPTPIPVMEHLKKRLSE